MFLNPSDAAYRAIAAPVIRTPMTISGFIWFATIPGRLAHGPTVADGPFFPTREQAVQHALTVYPKGIVARP
jgi:hypothetical protein